MEDQVNAKTGAFSIEERHRRHADRYPVREYVSAMAFELAQMARWDGDEHLAGLLEAAAQAAAQRPGE
ncbi:MAG: hypothetical protein ACK4FB_05180 [Brevundimonas sp.]|uniref:hypothetical protein n=1 Tax=Brevundimonas sp. TaxID=1871086 RepID=UPI0039187E1D